VEKINPLNKRLQQKVEEMMIKIKEVAPLQKKIKNLNK